MSPLARGLVIGAAILLGLFFLASLLPVGGALAGAITGLFVGLGVGLGVPLMYLLIASSPVLAILAVVLICKHVNRHA